MIGSSASASTVSVISAKSCSDRRNKEVVIGDYSRPRRLSNTASAEAPATATTVASEVDELIVNMSDGSNNSRMNNAVEREDVTGSHLTSEVGRLQDALNRLRCVFDADANRSSQAMKVAAHERLGEVLKILRQTLSKYPSLESEEFVGPAQNLIQQVKNFDYDAAENCSEIEARELHEALDAVAVALNNRVTHFGGNVDSAFANSGEGSTAGKISLPIHANLPTFGDDDDDNIEGAEDPGDYDDDEESDKDNILTMDQIDSILLRHDKGVDFALERAKIWSKYANNVMSYVDKRISMELDLARNLTKLAQQCRPVLNEESFLPFQSIYCMALDQVCRIFDT